MMQLDGPLVEHKDAVKLTKFQFANLIATMEGVIPGARDQFPWSRKLCAIENLNETHTMPEAKR